MEDRPGEGTKFTLDRKIFSSDIWFASPWKLKIWIYLIGQANHKDATWKGVKLKRGELVRSYRTIQKDVAYKVGYRTEKPSLHTVARICEELTKERRTALRREHFGQVITICNYNAMQLTPKYERNDERKDSGTMGEQNNNVNNENNILQEIFSLKKRYPDQSLIDKAFSAIALTRKSGKVSPSVLLKQLQKWERFPVSQVEAGITVYLDKCRGDNTKREEYLLGIIRNQKPEQQKPVSTGSSVLDAYYARNGH